MCGIVLCVEGVCGEGEFVGGLEDADCDFAAVGDEEGGYGAGREHHGLESEGVSGNSRGA